MFAWLNKKKLKPTAEVAPVMPGSRIGRIPQLADAAGTEDDALDTDPFPPHPLLSLLPPGTLQRLLANGAVAEYKKGVVIFRAGAECDALFLIQIGRAHV